jgi:tetratricopeptide (TPR) repeat protein
VKLWWLAVCVFVMSASARAAPTLDDEPIARDHYATGLAYYEKNDYRQAVREFLAAYKLAPRPPFLYNIARAYEKLGDPGRALDFYERYLKTSPDAVERDTTTNALSGLRDKVGEVVVDSNLRNVTILVDGEVSDHGVSEPIPLTVGHHRITLRSEGAVDSNVEVKVVGGSIRSLRLDLASVAQLQADAHRSRRGRWLWPVVGVAAAVVVGAAITLGLTLRHTDYAAEARSSCTGSSCLLIDGTHGFQ